MKLAIFILYVCAIEASFLFGDEDVNMCRVTPDDLPCDCDTFHQKLNCARKNMSLLLDSMSVPSYIKKMDFKGNKVTKVSSTHFDKVDSVEVLDLSENFISNIDGSAFIMFNKLKFLNLAKNNITSLNMKLFGGLENLEDLDLSYNKITYMETNNFVTLLSLKFFHLQYNPLKDMLANQTELFSYMPKLELLNLEKVGLTTLQDDVFKNCNNMKGLIVGRNPIENIPRSALTHVENTLEFLDLSDVAIKQLKQDSFPKLTTLRTLYLNNLHFLHKVDDFAFSELLSLETLMMHYNPGLSCISGKAFHTSNHTVLPELRELYLRNNNLEYLHLKTVRWEKMQTLDLQGNPWACDCRMHWTKSRLDPKTLTEMRCYSPTSLKSKSFKLVDAEKFTCGVNKAMLDVLLVAACMFAIILLVIAYSFYRYKVTESKPRGYESVTPTVEKVELEWDETDLAYVA